MAIALLKEQEAEAKRIETKSIGTNKIPLKW